MVEHPSPSSKASLSAGDHLGRYKIIGLLDEGGMGAVYRAHDPQLQRDVALKIMRWSSATPEQVARFSREARAAGSLNHPNIVVVLDAGSERGVPFVVTELLEGETLRQKMRPGLLPFRRAVEIGAKIAHALDAAHRKNIWHRDVKPANVFITNDWQVKLLDFGIAKLSEPDAHQQSDIDTASQTAGLHGTPGYMSPEQVLGEAIDHRTDIFSLGTVLYEMLTGARAFQRETSLETMNAVVHAEPADPLTINPKLSQLSAAVVHRCLEKNKENRFQTARDLAFQLEQLTDRTGPVPAPAPPVPRPSIRWLTAGAVVLLGAAVTALALSVLSSAAPTFERLTFSRGRIGGARFTPGGVGVVYSLASQGHELNVERIDDLTDSLASRPLNYKSGTDILAVRAGEVAVMLDPRFLQLERFVGTLGVGPMGSTPVNKGDNIEGADWSRTGELAVIHSAGKIGELSQIEYPQGSQIHSTTHSISFMRVSPNGQLVAFLEAPAGRRVPSGVVSIVDRSGKVTELTKDWLSARGLAWSANGKEVWFTAADDEKKNRALRAVSLDGKERVVWEGPGALTLWDITSDGRVLLTLDEERKAVMAQAPGEKTEHDVSRLDQSGLAAISRDGRSILGGDRFGMFVRRTDGTDWQQYQVDAIADDLAADGQTLLATKDKSHTLVVVQPGGNVQPVKSGGILQYSGAYWFPDLPPRRVLFTGQLKGENVRSFIQEVPNGDPKPMTLPGEYAVAISADGKRIAGVGRADGRIPIWSVEDGRQTFVTGATEGDRPAFREDGKSLWVFRRGKIPASVDTLDLLTGRRQPGWPLSPPDNAGVYSIVEFAITPDGRAYAYSYNRVLSQLYLAKGLK